MEQKEIAVKVSEIINEIFTNEDYIHVFPQDGTTSDKLQMLISESVLALTLVTSIEDEFDIEFEDDEVDISFFASLDAIVNLTHKYIK